MTESDHQDNATFNVLVNVYQLVLELIQALMELFLLLKELHQRDYKKIKK